MMSTQFPPLFGTLFFPPRPFAAIFWGGLLAGIFDITQALIGFGLLGAKPFRILQHIAGGVFGARSMQMGWTSAALGLVFHFTIAFHCRGGLLPCQPGTAHIGGPRRCRWSALWRAGGSVH